MEKPKEAFLEKIIIGHCRVQDELAIKGIKYEDRYPNNLSII